jgi:hypothetical protein
MKERNYKVRVLRVNGKNSKCWDGISLQDNKVAAPSFISMRIADA